MLKQTQYDIDQMIQAVRPTSRDLVRRDINQALSSPLASLNLRVETYVYNSGASKQLLCLQGTVACDYRGNRYNIPVEIWLQQDHPTVPPLAFVRPTPNMYISSQSRDVKVDGTIIIPYLKSWRHPQSDLITFIGAMSEAFSTSPPVYAGSGTSSQQPTSYQSTSTPYPSSFPMNSSLYPSNAGPYPTPYSSNPTPYSSNPTPYPTNSVMPMPNIGNTSYAYSSGYPANQNIDREVYFASLQTGVFDKVRNRLDEFIQIGNTEINSLKNTEQDLTNGERKLQSLITEVQQQQVLAQNQITNLRTKINEATETSTKVSTKNNENSVVDDALVLPAPVYKQLLQAYAEEHAIQDLLYYLADGLRRKSIGLDSYLKHVRELSRKQFILRATMRKCRQVAGLSIK